MRVLVVVVLLVAASLAPVARAQNLYVPMVTEDDLADVVAILKIAPTDKPACAAAFQRYTAGREAIGARYLESASYWTSMADLVSWESQELHGEIAIEWAASELAWVDQANAIADRLIAELCQWGSGDEIDIELARVRLTEQQVLGSRTIPSNAAPGAAVPMVSALFDVAPSLVMNDEPVRSLLSLALARRAQSLRDVQDSLRVRTDKRPGREKRKRLNEAIARGADEAERLRCVRDLVAVSSAAAWKLESLRLEDLAILRGVLALVPGPEACRLRRDVLVRLAPYLGEIGASDAESGLLGWMEAAPADPMIGDVNAALGALEWEVIDAIDGQFVATKGVRASVLASVMQNAKFSGIRPELVETLETHRDIEQVLDDARIKLERISRFIREQSDE